MLGSITSATPLNWMACGKHPAAGDYFKFGIGDSLVESFASWIENGYRRLISKEPRRMNLHSWRFWTKGLKKNSITCGICRDSSDKMGRPYPLIIVGNGILPHWEDHWELLLLIFEDIWNQIEYLASRRLADVTQIEEEMGRIKLQKPDWSKMGSKQIVKNEKSQFSGEDNYDLDLNEVAKGADRLLKQHEFVVSLNTDTGSESFMIARYWSHALKAHIGVVPSTLFMGGDPEKSYLAIFNRSLNTNDFVRLWSICSEDTRNER
jgi:type VI secretion system protein VasJ